MKWEEDGMNFNCYGFPPFQLFVRWTVYMVPVLVQIDVNVTRDLQEKAVIEVSWRHIYPCIITLFHMKTFSYWKLKGNFWLSKKCSAVGYIKPTENDVIRSNKLNISFTVVVRSRPHNRIAIRRIILDCCGVSINMLNRYLISRNHNGVSIPSYLEYWGCTYFC